MAGITKRKFFCVNKVFHETSLHSHEFVARKLDYETAFQICLKQFGMEPKKGSEFISPHWIFFLVWASVHLSSNDLFLKYTKTKHNQMPTSIRIEIRKMIANIKTRVNRETTAVAKFTWKNLYEQIFLQLHLLLLLQLKKLVSGDCFFGLF